MEACGGVVVRCGGGVVVCGGVWRGVELGQLQTIMGVIGDEMQLEV